MITWDGWKFVLEEENLKVFSSDFPSLTDIVGEAEKAARHARATGCQIKSAASWLRAWLKRADSEAAARKRTVPTNQVEVSAARAESEARAARKREAWLEAHCLARPADMPGEMYVELLRKELVFMTRKGALR